MARSSPDSAEHSPVVFFAHRRCTAVLVNQSDTQAYLPDPACTPGVLNPDVSQETIQTTICVKGFTKTIRPPTSYTTLLKKKQIIEYGYQDINLQHYEEDHLISLELGGSPKNPKNLWPEPHASINEKDGVENYLHAEVCLGHMSLNAAQQAIANHWYDVYRQLHPPSPLEKFVSLVSQFFKWLRSVVTSLMKNYVLH